MTPDQFEDFLAAYIECALWTGSDRGGVQLDANYGPDDIAPEARAKMRDDCAAFVASAGALLADWGADEAGHDFWLTRNGRSSGFWDRGIPSGEDLTRAAEVYGPCSLYVGDDGLIHLA